MSILTEILTQPKCFAAGFRQALKPTTLLLIVLGVCGCVPPALPEPSEQQTIIELYTTASNTLSAKSLNKKPVNNGQHFTVPEGKQTLEVRFQYQRNRDYNEDRQITCLMSFSAEFEMNKHYRLEARPAVTGGQLILTLDKQVIPTGRVNTRCGPY